MIERILILTWTAISSELVAGYAVARIFLGDRIDAISGAYSAFRARLSRDLGAAGQTFVRNYQWLRGHVKRLFLWLGWKRLSGDAYVEFFTATGVGFVALISFSYSLLRFLDKIMVRMLAAQPPHTRARRVVLRPVSVAPIAADEECSEPGRARVAAQSSHRPPGGDVRQPRPPGRCKVNGVPNPLSSWTDASQQVSGQCCCRRVTHS